VTGRGPELSLDQGFHNSPHSGRDIAPVVSAPDRLDAFQFPDLVLVVRRPVEVERELAIEPEFGRGAKRLWVDRHSSLSAATYLSSSPPCASQVRASRWCKDVAPSGELRKWYGHDPDRFAEFARRYRLELQDPQRAEALAHLRGLAEDRQLTLLTATRQPEISEAAVLAALLQG
jgi:uncharacterized protein YeaO (DUF488 family)